MRQVFDKADHVIAEIAVQARCNGRQAFGQVNPAFGDQGAQIVQGSARLILKRRRVIA